MNIRITPTSKRAKQRLKQHGTVMKLIKNESFQGEPAILVQSIDKTFRCAGLDRHWHGWFTETEASWEVVDEILKDKVQ